MSMVNLFPIRTLPAKSVRHHGNKVAIIPGFSLLFFQRSMEQAQPSPDAGNSKSH